MPLPEWAGPGRPGSLCRRRTPGLPGAPRTRCFGTGSVNRGPRFTCSRRQTRVEHDERKIEPQLFLKLQETTELDGVGGPQRICVQQVHRTPSHRGRQLDDVASGLSHVPLDQCTGIEVSDQNRSSRSSLTAPEKRRPVPTIGLAMGGIGFARPVTMPCRRIRARRASTERSANSIGITSTTGRPRSVMVKMRPWRTCRRQVPNRVLNYRAPTTSGSTMSSL